jgi:hypothetical protein
LRGGTQAGVLIGDDQADAAETALHELAEQPGPVRLVLLGADVDDERVTVTVRSDAVGDQGGDVLDGASPARVDERGIQVEVRDGIGDRLAAQVLHLVLEPAGHAAHRRPTDALAEQGFGDAAHVSRRDATYVGLRDRVVDLRPPSEVPPRGAVAAPPARVRPTRTSTSPAVVTTRRS